MNSTPQLGAAAIEKLCDDWCAASITPNGDTAIGAETERLRLLSRGVVFHELGHEQLCAALTGLSKVLLRPGRNAIVHQDHFFLWAWCGELLLGPPFSLFPQAQREIATLYETALRAALINCRKPPLTEDEWEQQNCIQDAQPHHAKQFLQRSGLVLGHLSFPLLEAVLKRACAAYVAFDGRVISPFSVLNKQGKAKQYDPTGQSSQCSSLRDLLLLHSTIVASPQLRAGVNRFRTHLASLDNTQDPFDLLYGWRNQSLHGSANFQTIGGTVLNLSLLISLFEIEHGFDQHRLRVLEHCRWEAQLPSKSPWSFYPPY